MTGRTPRRQVPFLPLPMVQQYAAIVQGAQQVCTAIRVLIPHAAQADKAKAEKKVDPVEAELKKYSIITSNPWEPEKP